MSKTKRTAVTLLWLTTLVGLSFFSGYRLMPAPIPIPFSAGALFLTPVGFFVHFLDPQASEIAHLYFTTSQRADLLNFNALILLIPLHSFLAFLLLFKRNKS